MRSSKNISLIWLCTLFFTSSQEQAYKSNENYKICMICVSFFGWSNLTSSSKWLNRNQCDCFVYLFFFSCIFRHFVNYFLNSSPNHERNFIKSTKKINACAVASKMTNGEIRMPYFWHFHQSTFFFTQSHCIP